MIGGCEWVVLFTSLGTRLHNPLRLVETQCNCVLRFQGLGRRSISLFLRSRLDTGPTTRIESDVAGSVRQFGQRSQGPKVAPGKRLADKKELKSAPSVAHTVLF